MKKKYQLAFLIILIFVINSCSGYKPIFGSTNLNFKIEKYEIEGDKQLARKIFNKLNRISKSSKDNDNIRKINLILSVTKNKEAAVRNLTGKITDYRISVETRIQVKDNLTSDEILDEVFNSSVTYKTQNEYSDTISLENSSFDNLMDKTYQDLLIKLSESIIN